jgi:hypothetical protein
MFGFIENLLDFIGEEELEFASDFETSWILEFYNDEANYD